MSPLDEVTELLDPKALGVAKEGYRESRRGRVMVVSLEPRILPTPDCTGMS